MVLGIVTSWQRRWLGRVPTTAPEVPVDSSLVNILAKENFYAVMRRPRHSDG
jgi:hypothetical protein